MISIKIATETIEPIYPDYPISRTLELEFESNILDEITIIELLKKIFDSEEMTGDVTSVEIKYI